MKRPSGTPGRDETNVAVAADAREAVANAAGDNDAFADEHIRRLQHALEQSNALAEQILARSRTLAAERDQARLDAASETARLSSELAQVDQRWMISQSAKKEIDAALAHSEALRSLAVSKHGNLEDRIAKLEKGYEILVDLFDESQPDVELRSSNLESLKTALESVRPLSEDDGADYLKLPHQLALHFENQSAVATRLKSLLEQAGQRIVALVDSRPSPWVRLGAFLRVDKKSEAFQNLAEWEAGRPKFATSSEILDQQNLPRIMADILAKEERNPFLRASSLNALLAFDDIDFVRCAYVTILGRQPDLPGQAQYVQQIRAGNSKLAVLSQLRWSAEAKQHDPGISGLDRALKRAAWQRRPVLGALSRLLRPDADSHSRRDRALRALMNATAVNQSHLEALGEQVSVIPRESAAAAAASQLPSLGQEMTAARTPELDHLRQKRVAERRAGDIAP